MSDAPCPEGPQEDADPIDRLAQLYEAEKDQWTWEDWTAAAGLAVVLQALRNGW